MEQADFSYAPAKVTAGVPVTVSIFADCERALAELVEDAELAQLSIGHSGVLETLADGEAVGLGDVVVIDCPEASWAVLAALSRIDMRAARSGSRLVVATSPEALDDVFACLDQSGPQILVNPARSERLVALGREAVGRSGSRLRELSSEDRLTLLKLTEQVGEIAERLDRFGHKGMGVDGGAFRFASPTPDYRKQDDDTDKALIRKPKPPLPDPRLVRRIIHQRQLRSRYFDGGLFADPAWDILLDLTAARVEHQRVSVTSLCIASGVPPTTALRWIGQMVDAGLLVRVADESDRRRAFIALSDMAAESMARYFAELGQRDGTGL